MTNFCIIIPSLNPEPKLIGFLGELRSQCECSIIVVNDGSRKECDSIFDEVSAISGVYVLNHCINMGKGHALKTAFNFFLTRCPDAVGVVTADADGQHLPKDIVSCVQAMRDNPECLILGCRSFRGKHIPWKSRLGNLLTISIFQILAGIRVSDTQTGLRGIPSCFLPHLLTCPGERFEYETRMLLETRRFVPHVAIREFPIATVYENGNRETHFKAIRDSLKIYRVILAFSLSRIGSFLCSGILSSVIDQGLFALLFYQRQFQKSEKGGRKIPHYHTNPSVGIFRGPRKLHKSKPSNREKTYEEDLQQ